MRTFILLAGIILFAFACTSSGTTESYDIIITNASIIDGLGNPAFQGDIALQGDKIALVSKTSLDQKRAQKLIDASGLTIAPGFIDLHTNIEDDIQNHPLAENFIRQGSTTLMASLHSGNQPYPMNAYTEGLQMAPNMGYFAGHSWIRKRILGLENRAPTTEELNQMKALVKEAMEDGALGLATGLEYVPANYAQTEEIIELSKIAAEYNGVHFTHMRDEGAGLLKSIKESIAIGKEAKIPVQINHLKAAGSSQWGWAKKALALIDSARAEGIQISQDMYPYTAYATYSYLMLPKWSMAGGHDSLRVRLQNPNTRQEIEEEIAKIMLRDAGGADLDKIIFGRLEEDPSFVGKTLADYVKQKDLEPTLENGAKTILDLESRGGFLGIFHAMSEEDIKQFMQHPQTSFDSDGDLVALGDGHPHPRTYGAFPRILGYYVRDKKILSLEQAIQKLTSMPAEIIGQTDRGRLEEGAYADITIFNAQTIIDKADYSNPHQYASGIEYVLVNGELVLEKGKMTGEKPGRSLKNK